MQYNIFSGGWEQQLFFRKAYLFIFFGFKISGFPPAEQYLWKPY